jgi:hypothetical protein
VVTGFDGAFAVSRAAQSFGAGWAMPQRKTREKWREELDKLHAPEQPKPAPKPVPTAEPAKAPKFQPPRLDSDSQAYIDGLFASIERARVQQEKARQLAAIAKADQETAKAMEMLAVAIEAERVAQQEMMDFDIAFVAAVLAHH